MYILIAANTTFNFLFLKKTLSSALHRIDAVEKSSDSLVKRTTKLEQNEQRHEHELLAMDKQIKDLDNNLKILKDRVAKLEHGKKKYFIIV